MGLSSETKLALDDVYYMGLAVEFTWNQIEATGIRFQANNLSTEGAGGVINKDLNEWTTAEDKS